jgi:tetratricopeptide (TPR) repeat protein
MGIRIRMARLGGLSLRLSLVSLSLLSLVFVGTRPIIAQPVQPVWVSQLTAEDYVRRGNQRSEQKDYQGAIADYNLAIRLKPNLAETYLGRGAARAELKDYQGSIADFTQAIRLDPKLVEAYTNRGIARLRQKDFQGAIADFDQAIRLNPNLVETYLGRGVARAELKDYQGAMADYNLAIRLKPNLAETYLGRGAARAELKDYQGSIADYNQAIRLNPNFAGAFNNRGNACFELKDFQGAMADYNQAIRLDPNNAYAYTNRGGVYYWLANYQSALADANKAIQLDPKLAYAYAVRGAAHIGLGKYQAARQDFDQAVQLEPTNGYAYYFRGLLSLKQGNNPAAIADYDKAVRLETRLRGSKIYEDYSLIARLQGNTPVAAATPPQPAAVSRPPATNPTPVAATTPAVTTSTSNVYRIANQTTVLIDGQNPGSGVIISRVGNTYYVLTAKHVVATPDEYTIVTSSGKKFPVDYSLVKKLNNLDLAVVQFTSSENFQVAQLANSEQLNQGDNIFVSGWPIIDGRSNQQVTDGRITGFRQGDANGYELTYNNATGGGMSGGPVFNANGQVIGIHGRGGGNQEVGKIGINLGIPIHLFVRQVPQTGLSLQQLGLRSQL